MNNTKHRTEVAYGAIKFTQTYETGYKQTKSCELQVRRVMHADEGEQLQIEIAVSTHHEKRTTSQHFSFGLPAGADLEAFVKAVTMMAPKWKEGAMLPFPDAAKITAEHYGLPAPRF